MQNVVFLAASAWFTFYCARLLYVAWSKGYVVAHDMRDWRNLFRMTEEAPQSRADNPQQFWANVIIAGLMLPVGILGILFAIQGLLNAAYKLGLP